MVAVCDPLEGRVINLQQPDSYCWKLPDCNVSILCPFENQERSKFVAVGRNGQSARKPGSGFAGSPARDSRRAPQVQSCFGVHGEPNRALVHVDNPFLPHIWRCNNRSNVAYPLTEEPNRSHLEGRPGRCGSPCGL